MKKTLAAAFILTASVACAADVTMGSSVFVPENPAAIKKTVAKIELPAVAKPEMSVISSVNLLAASAKDARLFSSSKNQTECDAFNAFWLPQLRNAGYNVTGTECKTGLAIINYQPKDGKVIRVFIGDEMNYDGTSEVAIAAAKDVVTGALEKNGLKVLSSYRLKLDIFRPTFVVYYETKLDEKQEHEKQFRILNTEDVDLNLLRAYGVNVVRTENSDRVSYLGREVGVAYRYSSSREGLENKVSRAIVDIVASGGQYFNASYGESDKRAPEYYVAALYFLR